MQAQASPKENGINSIERPKLSFTGNLQVVEASAGRERIGTRPQMPLHQDRVEPSAVFEAHIVEPAGMLKAKSAMQLNGGSITGIPNYCNHLTLASCFTRQDDGVHQGSTHPASLAAIRDVH
jgi:hypothetical protein